MSQQSVAPGRDKKRWSSVTARPPAEGFGQKTRSGERSEAPVLPSWFRCKFCGKVFGAESALRDHEQICPEKRKAESLRL